MVFVREASCNEVGLVSGQRSMETGSEGLCLTTMMRIADNYLIEASLFSDLLTSRVNRIPKALHAKSLRTKSQTPEGYINIRSLSKIIPCRYISDSSLTLAIDHTEKLTVVHALLPPLFYLNCENSETFCSVHNRFTASECGSKTKY